MQLSIIIPTLNEASSIRQTLACWRALDWPVELIVVDGGSTDGTSDLARLMADQVIESQAGRARQMNAGAAVASGHYLLFLHADTLVPEQTATELRTAWAQNAIWGRFDVRIHGKSRLLAVIGFMMNVRSRITGIATGDQAIFVRREMFESVGGFADQPLMEDIELSRKLLKLARPLCLKGPVVTSGRRWDQHGVWRTIALMWRLRWRYWRGEPADCLAREYQ